MIKRAAFVLMFVAACSSEKTPEVANTTNTPKPEPVAAKTDDACAMLTRSEAQGALGSPIKKVSGGGQPAPMGTMLQSSCFYRSENGGTITLSANTYPDEAESSAKFERFRRLYRGARVVAGLGDEALMRDQDLMVRRANVHLMVKLDPEGAKEVTNYSDSNQMNQLLDAERAIVARAITRLPSGAAIRASSGEGKGTCRFVTKPEMETILGGSLAHVVASGNACTYTGASGLYAQVTVDPQGGETAMMGSKLAGALMGAAGGDVKPVTKIEGLGDEATMMIGGVLSVRKGKASIEVDLRMQTDYETKGRAIAQKVLSRM